MLSLISSVMRWLEEEVYVRWEYINAKEINLRYLRRQQTITFA